VVSRSKFSSIVSFPDFLLANDVEFSVFIESGRKLNLRVASTTAENRELLE
jgi:hypothetical protein